MKFKVGKERIKGFISPVKTAEKTNDRSWWGLFGVIVVMEVSFILKMLGKI